MKITFDDEKCSKMQIRVKIKTYISILKIILKEERLNSTYKLMLKKEIEIWKKINIQRKEHN